MIISQGNVLQHESREEAWSYQIQERQLGGQAAVIDVGSESSRPQGAASESTSSETAPMLSGTTLAVFIILLIFPILGFAGWRIWVWRRHQTAGVGTTLDGIIWPVNFSAALPRKRSLKEIQSNLMYEPRVVASAPSLGNCSLPLPLPPLTDALPPSSLQSYTFPTYANVPAPALSFSNTNISPITPAPTLQITPPPAYTDTHASRTVSIPPFAIPVSSSTKLPRLVVVIATFGAALPDELEIHEGDTLRLLAEYEDEWCLVQPIDMRDRTNVEKGVVPRLCLADKPPGARSSRKSKRFPRLQVSLGLKR